MNQAALQDALAVWGGSDIPPRLISHRENAVYEVMLAGGRAALRLHRPGYRSEAEIWSELVWTEALADRGFAAPRPVRGLGGELITRLGDQMVTVIDWIEGAPIGAVGVPLAGTAADHAALYAEVGGLLARLHNVTDTLDLPGGFARPFWDRDGLTGEAPLWGRYWEVPGLSAAEAALLRNARDRARSVLHDYDAEADTGLIHADALRENVFRRDDGLTLIDFDDSGFGYRMYDLASAVTQSVDDDTYGAIVDGLLRGYAAQRPLSNTSRGLFPLFEMLRAFSSLGWTMPRIAPDHPKVPLYTGRALRAAERFLSL